MTYDTPVISGTENIIPKDNQNSSTASTEAPFWFYAAKGRNAKNYKFNIFKHGEP